MIIEARLVMKGRIVGTMVGQKRGRPLLLMAKTFVRRSSSLHSQEMALKATHTTTTRTETTTYLKKEFFMLCQFTESAYASLPFGPHQKIIISSFHLKIMMPKLMSGPGLEERQVVLITVLVSRMFITKTLYRQHNLREM